MAEEVTIGSTGEVAKVRSPIAVIVLTFVTIGIYGFVWYYKVNKELAAIGRERGTAELGDNPMKSLLAITLGALLIVPAIVSMINSFKRVQAAQRLEGSDPVNGWLGLVLVLVFSPALFGYMQSGMNAAVQALPAGAAPAAIAPA